MGEPIRILHVLGTLNRGGAETMVMNIYRNIDRGRVQFDFVIHTNEKCDYDDEIIKLGGKIYNMPRYTGNNHIKYNKSWINFFMRHTEYKIVHGHMRSTAAIYLNIAKKHGLKTIAHSHSTASRGNKFERLVKNVLQIPLRYIADYLFACSEEAGKWLFGKKTIKKEKYKIINNAIDTKQYYFNEIKRNESRKNLSIEDKFVLGHVGNFTYPKNHKFLIEIFFKIQKQNENTVLLLIGDGELRPQIENQIDNLGIANKVILMGSVSNVSDYMQAMDVFVFPSIFEGLGMALIEAQAVGLKCIVSDVVPKNAIITDLIETVPLKDSETEWVNKILKYRTGYEKTMKYDEVEWARYDIKSNALMMERLYLQMSGENING